MKPLASTSFVDGTLTLNFSENSLTSIEAGKPYIVKWTKEADYVDDDAHNIVNPVFNNVTISNTTADVTTDAVTFHGIFSPYDIGAFRAYFQLADGLTASPEPSQGGETTPVRAFVLNFGDEASSVTAPLAVWRGAGDEAWYTLDGRRLAGKPSSKGIYINNGNKIIIK